MKRWRRCSALVLLAVVTAAGCTSKSVPRTATPPLGWDPGVAEAANGTPAEPTALAACGSATDTYLAELLHVPPTQAKVSNEWGDIVPGGKQVAVSGTAAATHLGPTDLPVSHPFGDDLSMDVAVDPPFTGFIRNLGSTGPAESSPGELHVEISSGLIPHRAPPAPPAGETWRQASDIDLTGFQPGFDKPAVGDRLLAMGRWIIDCGHPNFQTELHPLSFLAWAHTQQNATVVRTYVNPYRDAQVYSPDASILGKVDDPSRLTAPGSQPFVPFLVNDVLRVVSGQADRLQSQELLEAIHASPPPWQVCAPAGATGKALDVHYDIVTRPGVTVKVTPHTSTGCASVVVTLGKAYRPLDVTFRACSMPWTYLDEVAHAALEGSVDVKSLIDSQVPASLRGGLDNDPTTTCADPLSTSDIAPSPAGRSIRVDAGQAFPFAGVVTIARTGS